MVMNDDTSAFAKELGFVSKLHHENIVQFVGLFRDDQASPSRYFLVTELAVRPRMLARGAMPYMSKVPARSSRGHCSPCLCWCFCFCRKAGIWGSCW